MGESALIDFRVALISISIDTDALGVSYLAAVLQKEGYAVRKFQLVSSAMKTYEVSDADFLSRGEEAFFDEVIGYDPDFLGFSLLHQIFGLSFLKYGCEKVKKLKPSVHICCGGHFATFNAERILRQYPLVDTIVRGEGEHTTVELLGLLRSGRKDLGSCKGIYYRDTDGRILATSDRDLIANLDELPFPDRIRPASDPLKRFSTPILTSRGCTGKCSFCDQPGINRYQRGKRWRGRSIKSVVDEIQYVMARFDEKYFTIVDSSFEDPSPSIGFERIRKFAEEIIDRELTIRYYVNFRTSSFSRNEMDDAFMKLMVRSGLSMIFIGIESFLQRDLDLYNKRADVKDNVRALEFLSRYPVSVRKGLIMFNPYTTLDDLKENFAFVKKYKMSDCLRHFLMQLAIFSGASIINALRKDGLFDENQYNHSYYCYRYVDPRVEHFAKSIRDLAIRPEIKKRWVQIEENRLVALNLRFFYGHLLNKEIQYFENVTKDVAEQLKCINDTFFESCIELAESGWNDSWYKKIEKEYIYRRFVPKSDMLFDVIDDFYAMARRSLLDPLQKPARPSRTMRIG